jgi:hypothetical protein
MLRRNRETESGIEEKNEAVDDSVGRDTAVV